MSDLKPGTRDEYSAIHLALFEHTFVAVDRALLNDHGPSIKRCHLFCFSPAVADIWFLLSICRLRVNWNAQYMAS